MSLLTRLSKTTLRLLTASPEVDFPSLWVNFMAVLPWRRNPHMQIFCRVMKMKLDETRSNEAHIRQVALSFDSLILVVPKDPVQANPLKGWNNAYHGTSRRGIICPTRAHVTEEGARTLQCEEPTQPRVVDGYASHRGYPILKPPHTSQAGSDTCQRSSARSRAILWP